MPAPKFLPGAQLAASGDWRLPAEGELADDRMLARGRGAAVRPAGPLAVASRRGKARARGGLCGGRRRISARTWATARPASCRATRRCACSGQYEPGHQFLLDNMSHGGRAGYQVLTPFRLEDGRLLLVNRGWLPLPDERRERLPDLSAAGARRDQHRRPPRQLPVAGLASGQAPPSPDPAGPSAPAFRPWRSWADALGQDLEARQLLLARANRRGTCATGRMRASAFRPSGTSAMPCNGGR